jgi:hypothetical protein
MSPGGEPIPNSGVEGSSPSEMPDATTSSQLAGPTLRAIGRSSCSMSRPIHHRLTARRPVGAHRRLHRSAVRLGSSTVRHWVPRVRHPRHDVRRGGKSFIEMTHAAYSMGHEWIVMELPESTMQSSIAVGRAVRGRDGRAPRSASNVIWVAL